ncbi:hypothetical protein JOC78_000812 [Bacillus ectoiniformans]|uniref:hypothetical protein n=1 Tax=Bacillus ectoiniformans TaxID=1494429 RepID=UPI00195E68C1|nr:hypothetical protein [Bacillus ectoiniformans]MBM7647872.1 hypothetical protein [Bacillus ectoiniformans]
MSNDCILLKEVKTSAELNKLLEENFIFVSLDKNCQVSVETHLWKDYAFYKYEDLSKYGICPISHLSSLVKIKEV